jgi:hypothetical protein
MNPFLKYSLKVRRGVGAIIGGSFIILMLFSAYGFYLINYRIQNNYNEVINYMMNEDIDKEQEKLIVYNIETDRYSDEFEPDDEEENIYTIWINVKNEGPDLIQLLYYQITDSINSDYNEIKEKTINISPGETAIIDVIVPNEDESISRYLIQLITERGNVFSTVYPFDQSEFMRIMFNLHDVIGDILPVYKSFKWSKVKEDSIIEWHSDWRLLKLPGPAQDKWYALSIRVRYFGIGDLVIQKESYIHLQNLGQQEFKELFIVSLDGDKIVPYEEQTLREFPDPPEIEFVFAAKEPGGLPGSSQLFKVGEIWQVSLTFLGIKEEGTPNELGYGQSFPLIAIKVQEQLE